MKVEISIGELVDKVSILDIKLNKIKDKAKIKNIQNEFLLLKKCMIKTGIDLESDEYLRLKKTNQILWDVEDKIRIKEKKQLFDNEFIQIARSIYFENDKRAQIKKEINLKFDSTLVEEKEYIDYQKK